MAARRAGSCGFAACTGTTGRSSGSAGARGPRSTWWASITPRSAAARSWPLPGYLQATSILSVELAGSAEADRPFRHRGRYKLHLGTAEVSAVLSLLETDESSAGPAPACSAFSRRAGGRGLRPAVRVCVLKARPRRWGAAGSFSRRHDAFARRDHVSLDRLGRLRSADRCRATACRPGVSRARAPGPSAGSAR